MYPFVASFFPLLFPVSTVPFILCFTVGRFSCPWMPSLVVLGRIEGRCSTYGTVFTIQQSGCTSAGLSEQPECAKKITVATVRSVVLYLEFFFISLVLGRSSSWYPAPTGMCIPGDLSFHRYICKKVQAFLYTIACAYYKIMPLWTSGICHYCKVTWCQGCPVLDLIFNLARSTRV